TGPSGRSGAHGAAGWRLSVAGLPEDVDEAVDGGGEELALPVDDRDRTDEAADRERNGAQHPDSDLLRHRRPGQDAHAGRDGDRLLDRLDVVELHDDLDADARLTQDPVDGA